MWILPVLAYGLLVIIGRRLFPSRDLRETLLAASVAWGALLVLITEGLGAVRSITPLLVTLAWAVACGALFVLSRRRGDWSLPPLSRLRPLTPVTVLMLASSGVVIAISGLIALLATPTNHDSMTYHLSRVMHWAQNQSLAFYPTHIPRQLHQPPAGEMILLHLYLLNGDDRWFNLVQWLSMIGSVTAVSAIARRLGADARGQLLAACLCALLPMGILQASSTQNSYVVTFWLLVLALEILIFGAQPTVRGALIVGASLGLAIATKGTAYVFGAPLILLGLAQSSLWRQASPRLLLVTASAAAGAMLLLNVGQYSRNLALYGSPIGPGKEEEGAFSARYANDQISPQIIASNLLRNLGLQIGTGLPAVDDASRDAIERAHEAIGIASDDGRSTWPGTRFNVDGASRNEDGAGNLVHLVLIGLSVLGVVASARHRSSPLVNGYVVALACGVVLFAALLRWQPWHARLHVTWFALAMPLVGMVLGRLPAATVGVLVVLAALWAWPALVTSRDHPLIGERSVFRLGWHEQMFVNTVELGGEYRNAAQLASGVGCSQIGLHLGADDAEYPWWRMIQPLDGVRRIEHFGVVNPSADLGRSGGPFQPCMVMSRRGLPGDVVALEGRDFELERRFGQVAVLRPAGEPFPLDASFRERPPAEWSAGQAQRFQVTATNVGTRIWPSAGQEAVQLSLVLRPLDFLPRTPPEEIRIALPADLAPGADWTTEVEMVAPSEPGKYALLHRLVHGSDHLHPHIYQADVEVVQPPTRQERRRR